MVLWLCVVFCKHASLFIHVLHMAMCHLQGEWYRYPNCDVEALVVVCLWL